MLQDISKLKQHKPTVMIVVLALTLSSELLNVLRVQLVTIVRLLVKFQESVDLEHIHLMVRHVAMAVQMATSVLEE